MAMGLVFYLDAGGSDANGGSSEGVAIAGGASATITGGNAQIDLSGDAPDLSGVSAGEAIRLDGRSDGVNGSDIFEITAVNDAADRVTVDPVPGASGTGVTWAIGGAWQTFQRAMDTVSPGDRVWCKAGTYTHDPDADGVAALIQRAGSATSPIVFEGYKSVPGDAAYRDDDAYRATIDGSAGSLSEGVRPASALDGQAIHYVFKHVRVTGCTNGFSFFTVTVSTVALRFVRLDGMSNIGIICGPSTVLDRCTLEDNGFSGMTGSAHAVVLGGRVENNATGLFLLDSAVIVGTRFRKNATAVSHLAGSDPLVIINATMIGDAGAGVGLNLSTTVPAVVVNTLFHDLNQGISAVQDLGDGPVMHHNLFAATATPRVNVAEGEGDVVVSSPEMIDVAAGDDRLRFTSPARGAGWPEYADIGARPRRELGPAGPLQRGVQA